jgi:hypothetical protein
VRPPAPAATTPLTWLLAIAFLIVIDGVLTHTSLLWGKTDTWIQSGIERLYIWQTYDVARKIYHPQREADERIAILGNSRIWFPARDAYVERALERLDPDIDVRVDNLAIFGARIGDLEIISRHLDELQPTVVVVGLSGADLVPTSWGNLVNPTGELLDVGWRDGPVSTNGPSVRVDRWLRTVWPLYRWRRFVRARIEDWLFPTATDTRYPDHFSSLQEYFEFANGPQRGAAMATAYERWRRDGTLNGFVAYLGGSAGRFGLSEPVPPAETLTLESPGVLALDRLLARLAAMPSKTFILLMPESPLLDADTEGQYHNAAFSERAADLIGQVAARYHIPVVDGRRWMPADRFVDFNHVLPDLSGFQDPLATEILHALGS